MTFWERFYTLCKDIDTKPNPVASKLGISSATITRWKNGTLPNSDALVKISTYFDCSTDYLLGKTDIKKEVAKKQPMSDELTALLNISASLSADNLLLLQKLAEKLADTQNQEES